MNQASIKSLLLLSLLVPFKTMAREEPEINFDMELSADNLEMLKGKKCKKFCSISARKACIGDLRVNSLTVDDNLTVDGSLIVNGVDFNSLITIVNILNAGTPLVRSVVPFSSGLLSLAAESSFPFIEAIPLTGLVMGFGSSSLVPVAVPTSVIPTQTGFSFSVPEAGTLYNLRVSVDSAFVAALGAETPITFTFTVLQSPCVDGTTSAYTATSLTATATTTTPAGTIFPLVALTAGTTGCGSNAAGIPVAAGDRITILVTPSVEVSPLILATAAFSAGLDYAPTL